MALGPPLHRPPAPTGVWLARHVVSLIAVALGLLDSVVSSFVRDGFLPTPDLRMTGPWLAGTTAACVVAIARRERPIAIPLLGVGLAVAALVLGWFLLVALVLVGTLIVITLLHAVL